MPKDQVKEEPIVELQKLFPLGGRVEVSEPYAAGADEAAERKKVSVRVRALTMRQIMALLNEALLIAKEVQAGTPTAEVVAKHTTEVLALAAAATDRAPEWLEGLDGGDFIRLIKGFMGANADFLEQLRDLLYGETGAQVSKMLRGAGPTSSPSSTATE